jgi:hypothetical protein
MDTLIFSKDRAFQVYTLLETLNKHIKGLDNIIVQFSYSSSDFLEGYKKISQYFDNVTFIDETRYGFYNTLKAILETEINSSNIFLEVDDVIYIEDEDLDLLEKKFNNEKSSKLAISLDPTIFDSKYYTLKDNLVKVDKSLIIDNQIQDLVLKYSFNVSGVIHRKSDLEKLLLETPVNNPIELEIKGSTSLIFDQYPYNLYNTKEVCKQFHTNNSFKRYEEVFNAEYLNKLVLEGKVLDINTQEIKSYPSDMRWFNGENIGRFPIFPWEIAPKYHYKIINKLKNI